jgi:hypothetical protein
LGWKSVEEVAPRKDYALFINIEAVGIINKNDEGIFKHGTQSRLNIGHEAARIN